jgi:hypothetical protein
MTLSDKVKAIRTIEKCIHNYSTYFVDWERLYHESGYRVEMPADIIEADKALKLIAAELGKENAL